MTSRYPRHSLKRAERAFRCSPFQLQLLQDMQINSVALRQICDQRGVLSQYSRHRLSELQAENEMMWLIAVGIFRREVDGQGLTDSFRLTPMGRQILQILTPLPVAKLNANWKDHLYNAVNRWLRIPIWLLG